MSYKLRGIVREATTHKPVGGLRVEALDDTGTFADIVAYSKSSMAAGSLGSFELTVDDRDIEDHFAGVDPVVYFRVIDESTGALLADTHGSQTWRVLGPAPRDILILISDSRRMVIPAGFVVRGRILTETGGPQGGMVVRAFDVDAFDDPEGTTDPTMQLGADFTTGADGCYHIAYAPDDLFDGKTRGDLVVRVYNPGVPPDFVKASEVRCQAPPAVTIDVVLDGEVYRGPTEHDTLLAAVGPMITRIELENLSGDQINRVACASARGVEHVQALSRAHLIAAQQPSVSLNTETLYGLIRDGLPDDRKRLLSTPRHQLRNALTRAVNSRIIGNLSPEALTVELDSIRDAVVELAKETPTGLTTCNVDQVIAAAQSPAISAAKRDAFHAYYAANEDTAGNMWTNAVGVGGLTSQEVADIQQALQWGVLTRYYLPLIEKLRDRKIAATWVTLEDLAALDEADWLAEINSLTSPGFPDGMPGTNDDERRANYAALLTRTMESAMPTRAIAGRIKKADPGSDLDSFFSQNTAFDFRAHRVAAFFPSAPKVGVTDEEQLRDDLGRMERLFKVAPRHAEMKPLLDAGFDSARSIARFGRQRFLDTYAGAVGGLSNAKRIYDQAVLQSSAAALIHLWFNPWANGPGMRYLPSFDGSSPPADDLVADWATIFGSLDTCACEHCQSVFSASAYLVDLLSWLGRYDSNLADNQSYIWTAKELLIGGDHSGLNPPGETLTGRRPDIARLLLSCNNTFTVMPYIDLVIELLEWRVAGAALPAQIETEASSAELLAAPEILDPVAHQQAYDTLASAHYPWILPYSLYHHQARVYLEHLGAPRHQLMEDLQRGVRPTQIAGCRVWLRADLGVRVADDGRLAEWLDLSGHGNDAVQDLESVRPLRGTADDGLAFVQFDGAERLRIEPAGSLDVTTAATIVVVASHVAPGAAHCFVFKGAVGPAQNYGVSRSSADAALAHYTNVVQTGPAWPAEGTAPSAIVTILEASQTTWRLDGSETQQTGQTNTLSATVEPLHIGARATDTWPTDTSFDTELEGRIYEIILYDRVLDAAELADLEGYLASRYGATIPALSPAPLQIAQERLGMTKTEREIVKGDPPYSAADSPWLRWGFSAQGTWDQDLKRASTFLEASDLSYEQLRELLDAKLMTTFTSAGDQPVLASELGYDGCDPEHLLITGLDETSGLAATWNTVQRFLRLRRRLGWAIRELDKVVTALSGASFDDAFIQSVGYLASLRRRLPNTGVVEMAVWWGLIDTHSTPSLEEPSLYASVFLNRALKNPPPDAFETLTGTEDLVDHLPHALASIRMREADFALLANPDEARTRLRLSVGLTEDKLNLESLSRLLRIASFARAADLRIADLRVLAALTGLAPLMGDSSSLASNPYQTRLFLEELDRLKASNLAVPEIHYLVRHVPRSSEGVAAEDLGVQRSLDAVETGLEDIALATTYVEDTTGKNLRALLTRIIVSENPGLPAEHVAADVDIVMGIVDGSRLFEDDAVLEDDDARRGALERVLGRYVGDIDAIKSGLVYRPWDENVISGCQLWLDPQGIAHTGAAVSGWTATAGSATVRFPVLTELADCVLWLRADLGVTVTGSGVSLWEDQSGSGNDFSQSTDASRPPLIASEPGLNGHAAVHFDDLATYLTRTSVTSDNAMTITVAYYQEGAGNGTRVMLSAGADPDALWLLADTLDDNAVGVSDGGVSGPFILGPDVEEGIGQYHSFVFRTSPTAEVELYKLGSSQVLAAYSGARELDNTVEIGRAVGGTRDWGTGKLAELAVFDRALEAEELAFVHRQMAERYALPGPLGPRYIAQGPFGLPAVQLHGRKDYLVLEGLSYAETSHTFACIVRQASTDTTKGMALLDVADGSLVIAANTQTAGGPSVGFFDGGWTDHAGGVTGDQLLTWTLDDSGNAAQIYRDGEPLSESPTTFSASVAMGGIVALGGRVGPSSGSFDGMIACAAIYNRALDPAELEQLHDYLLTMAGKPPARRFELVEKPLLDFWRLREARGFIKQSLASSTGVPSAVAAALLDGQLSSLLDEELPLIEDLLPATHVAPRPTTRAERFDAVMRFSKAATVVQRLRIGADELGWLYGPYGDAGWLDLNELPLTTHGIEVFDAQHAARVDGAFELPRWLTVTCPTAERSAQTSASTVRAQLGADAARAVSRDGASWALLVEPARDNLVTEQDWREWTQNNAPRITTAVTPAGDVAHVEIFDDDLSQSETVTRNVTTAAVVYTVSGWTWVLTAPIFGSRTLVWLNAGTSDLNFEVRIAESAWTHHDDTGLANAGSWVIQQNPRGANDSGVTRFWGTQVELGSYPTSFIGSDNATFSRAADTLAVDPTELTALAEGYFLFTLRYAPLYAHGETAADHDLLFVDATHRVYFRQSDQRIVATWDTETVTSDPLTFTRHREITVSLSHLSNSLELTVSGAGSGNGTFAAASSPSPITWQSAFYLLGNASGAQEGGALRYVRFERPDPEADLPGARRRYAALMRLADTLALRDQLRRRGAELFELFAATAGPETLAEADWLATFSAQTQYPHDDVVALATHHRLSYPADYRSERGLSTVLSGLELAKRLGVSAARAIGWTDVDAPGATAQAIAEATLDAAKDKHAAKDWPEIGRPLRDELRSQQRDALVAHALHADPELDTPADLYNQLLVDPEMSPCALTSRIANAISSVQLYIHRILLGLEDTQLDKDAREQWKWRKNYRVWEANRKVLIRPENWIFPELRDDKTPLFEKAESKLRQGDITDALAEDAYRDYLEGLDEIAQLDAIGMVHHNQPATEEHKSVDEIHIFARSFGTPPYLLYHRKWVDRAYFTPWEKLPFETEATVKSYLPVIDHGRLSLHWLTVSPTDPAVANPPTDSLASPPRMQIHTSQFDQRKWGKPRASAMLEVPFAEALVYERDAEHPDHGAVLVRGSNLVVARAVIDPCRGMFEKLEAVDLDSLEIDRTSIRLTWDSQEGVVTLDSIADRGPLASLFEMQATPETINSFDVIYEVSVPRVPGATTTSILERDALILRAGRRRLFGAFDPVPSMSGTHDYLVARTWYRSDSTIQINQIPFIDNPFLESAPQLKELDIPNSISQVLVDPGPRVRFQSFWHPYVCEAREVLYRHGLSGLRDYFRLSPTPLQELKNEYFSTEMLPANAIDGARVDKRYPRDEFELHYGGAYSTYNWELFFHLPMLLATWLKDARRFEEAREWLHAIFDPTDGDITDPKDVWRFRRFREVQSVAELQSEIASGSPTSDLAKWLHKVLGGNVSAESDAQFEQQIEAWERDPFNPHLIARMRPVAYMKKTVRLYIELLIDWADHLFRQDTVEAIIEAQQLYILALQVLGDRPITVERPGEVVHKTYLELDPELDPLGNALVELEGVLPVVAKPVRRPLPSLPELEVAYFCVPHNDELIELWDIVEDRLFKIRHCMNIEGVVRQLPLFQPPIDPGLLVKAKAAGLDIASVLSQLYAPPPLHRYQPLYQRAVDFAQYVTSLGQSLLSALEKQDAEALAALRADHEISLLQLVKETREHQVRQAEESLEAARRSREIADARRAHYEALLATAPAPSPGAIHRREQLSLAKLEQARTQQTIGSSLQAVGQVAHFVPQFNIGAGCPPHGTTSFGGANVGAAFTAMGMALLANATALRDEATREGTMAGYGRRSQDWQIQHTTALAELRQMDKQIAAAEIQLAIAQSELRSHERQLEQSEEVRAFLADKFTNEQLYFWMIGELQETYYQAYKLAFDMARRAERAWQFDRLEPDAFFIQHGYWDGFRKGLLAGDKLLLDLRRMEAAYLERDRRDYELTKSISLAEHGLLALVTLRETGSVVLDLPESLFDRDYPGHYFRRIKSVSLTIPAVAGPHTSINCKLSLLSHKIRVKSTVSGGYGEATEGEDPRFTYAHGQVDSVCTSRAVNDSGMFELDFRSERLLPFEGAGVVSRWRIDLPKETNRFDLRSLSDVILHIQYTAREGGGVLGEAAKKAALAGELPQAARLISVKDELSAAWTKFQTLDATTSDQVLELALDKKLPYVPGTGPTRLVRLHLALEIDHADAANTELAVRLAPAGDPTPNPVKLFDASVSVALVDYENGPVDVSGPLTITVSQDTIKKLPAELTEETPPGSGLYRLSPSIFSNIWMLAEIERDPPVV